MLYNLPDVHKSDPNKVYENSWCITTPQNVSLQCENTLQSLMMSEISCSNFFLQLLGHIYMHILLQT